MHSWRLRSVALALTFGLAFAAGSGVADAWVHPVNALQQYYMSGPPPGSYLSACIVDTYLLTNSSGDRSSILPYDNAYSACRSAGALGVFLDQSAQQLVTAPGGWTNGSAGVTTYSVGQVGMPIFGSYFVARNLYSYEVTWGVTIL